MSQTTNTLGMVKDVNYYRGATVLTTGGYYGAFTVGSFIIGDEKNLDVQHEYGHYLQSQILGPAYLLAIALPSIIHAAFYKGEYEGYFDFYTESWANKLSENYFKQRP